MNELPTITEAIRTELFRKAETLNLRLLHRFANVTDHISARQDRAVIGALEGTEADIATMRSIMLLARDCFPPPNQKENV